MKDIATRWELLQRVREPPAFNAGRDPALTLAIAVPPIEVQSINASADPEFQRLLKDVRARTISDPH